MMRNVSRLVSLALGLFAALLLVGCQKETPPPAPAVAPKPAAPAVVEKPDYLRAVYSPLHFKPAIETATDAQCLECHQEIIASKVRPATQTGLPAARTLAWYQQLTTYAGEQDTFHRRHLETPLAKRVMALKCNTCHEGHNPREEAPIPPTATDAGFTLRKQTNPETTCLKCHGQMNWQIMGLPGPWHESKQAMGNNCLTCHAAFRTVRHQVNYLNAPAIEADGAQNADLCHGCHGGRAWYRISYPYPRHAWPGMQPEVPDWAKGRPTESEPRFRLPAAQAAAQPAAAAAPATK